MTEYPTKKPKILGQQRELPTWAAALLVGVLFMLAGVLAVAVR